MTAPMRWRCDTCGEWLTAQQGYVVWHSSAQNRDGFHIVHTNRCDDRSRTASNALIDFLGANGLSYALSFMSDGPIRLELNGKSSNRSVETDQFADFVRRLHVPLYEEAREYFKTHTVLEDYSDSSESAPYRQQALQNIIDTSKQESRKETD